MRRPGPTLALIAVAFAFAVAGCRRANQPNLRVRILAANTSQYCLANACFNPVVLAVENGLEVTTFRGSHPSNVHVPARDLERYLQSLPMEAWPRGASITLTRSDDVIDEKAIERNLEDARQLFQLLGLEVQFRPGG